MQTNYGIIRLGKESTVWVNVVGDPTGGLGDGFFMVRVIVVDDDVDTVAVFSEYLEIKGIEVIGQGYGGKEAVELYERLAPDVVLLDIMMPEYDGFYALRKIKKMDPNAKVIMVTADLTYDAEKLWNLGVSAIVYKPYDIDGIIQTIQNVHKGMMET
ncbi:MAG: response regulator [Candidatus Nitrosotenuis sp.]